ncbi:hypothetical protein [Phenylobacterium sp.]|uniref:hypothetical protein n=1 Tax=Phenylobacterium sp. TaxID=1871053 RepID=UPI0037C7179D
MQMLVAIALIWFAAVVPARASSLVIWAWERPEDLRFAPASAEIAVQTGFIVLAGDRIEARGRRFPLRASQGRLTTSVVHLQLDHRHPVVASPDHARRVAAAVLRMGSRARTQRLQVDFEVRASERPLLLAVLREVRAGLQPGVVLSMTALASWCGDETWLDAAPVDEIVPMLFRMGPAGSALKSRLAAGGDFSNPRCRTALAVSTDAPIIRAPVGRRVYLFSPRSWTPTDFDRVRRRVEAWSDD